MNKIKKILIFVTCFCLSFVFLFSINFARSNTVKADYNLFDYKYFYDTLNSVNSANIIYEVKDSRNCLKISSPNLYQNIQLYKGEYTPNVAYTFSIEFYLESTEPDVGLLPYIKYTDGSELGLLSNTFNTWVEFSVTTDPNKTIDSINITYGVPSTISYFNVDFITLSYLDENLGSAYEQGYNNGMTKRDARTWTAVSDADPRLPGDTVFNPNWTDSDYQYMPLINDINPFGSVQMGLLPGTYRISFKNKASGYYPLMYDFQGLIYRGTSFNIITPICGQLFMGDSRAEAPSLDVFNLSNSFYSFADARSCEPIVFNVPSSWASGSVDYATVRFFMMKCDSSYNFIDWDNFTEPLFFDLCSLDVLDPSSSYNQGYTDGYDLGTRDGISSGYDRGYDEGFNDGVITPVSNSITTSWFTSFLSSTFDILNINIFPNVKLIYLVFIPIGLGVLALILKMARG